MLVRIKAKDIQPLDRFAAGPDLTGLVYEVDRRDGKVWLFWTAPISEGVRKGQTWFSPSDEMLIVR